MGSDDLDSAVGGGTELGGAHETPDCIVKVSGIEVKGLKTASFFSQCHPYVAIQLGAQRMKTGTGTGSEFAWPSSSVMTFETVKSRLPNLKLSVKVFDKELITRKRPLGNTAIKLAALGQAVGLDDQYVLSGRPIESWFALEGTAGQIYLKVTVEAK